MADAPMLCLLSKTAVAACRSCMTAAAEGIAIKALERGRIAPQEKLEGGRARARAMTPSQQAEVRGEQREGRRGKRRRRQRKAQAKQAVTIQNMLLC